MRLLLDTHVLLWLARSPRLPAAATHELLERSTTVVFVSSVTFWEVRLKWERCKPAARKGLMEPAAAIVFAEEHGFRLAPLAPTDCTSSLDPPLAHRDPFDEQLLIHAQRLGARLLTRDGRLIGHPLALSIS